MKIFKKILRKILRKILYKIDKIADKRCEIKKDNDDFIIGLCCENGVLDGDKLCRLLKMLKRKYRK